MSFFLGPKSRPKSNDTAQTAPKPPSRANSIQISDRQFITPDINLINSVTNAQGNGSGLISPTANSFSTPFPSSSTQPNSIYNVNSNNHQQQPVLPSIASALPPATVTSFFGNTYDYPSSGKSPSNVSVSSSSSSVRTYSGGSVPHHFSAVDPSQTQYLYSVQHQQPPYSFPPQPHPSSSLVETNRSVFPDNSEFISSSQLAPPVGNPASIPLEEAVFDDLEYHSQYDVYWDALETLEEDYTKIEFPEGTAEPLPSQLPPNQQPPPSLYNSHSSNHNNNNSQYQGGNGTISNNTSNYSLHSDQDRPSSTRKHRREEIDLWEAPDGTEHVYPNAKEADEDTDEGIKAMRYGSLGRIIASSVAASSLDDRRASISERTPEQQIEYRKEFVSKFMKFLSQSNMNGLAKLIREKFHEVSLLITPELYEPIHGRADIMIMFALLLESYPDSVWTIQSTTVTPPDAITCMYRFIGTKLFSYPLASLYRQIKAHIAKLALYPINGERELSGIRLVNEVVDYIHITPPSTASLSNPGHHPLPLQPPLPSPGVGGIADKNNRLSLGSHHTGNTSSSNNNSRSNSLCSNSGVIEGNSDWGDSAAAAISLPRRDQSLREVRNIETAVLKEGSTSYRRKIDFYFDELDRVVRVIVINVVS